MEILKDMDLSISEGDFVVILGKSGCGKSTLLNILAGLTPPTSGEVLIDGKIITGPHHSRPLIFQHPSLLPWLNVKDNISFGCKIRGERKDLENRVKELIDLMELNGSEKVHPPELSVGMAHRVCLARAFLGKPEILLMDEPFGALDIFTRARIQEVLLSIWREKKFTAVFVTHDIDEAIILGNRVVLLNDMPCRIIDTVDIDPDISDNPTASSFIRMKKKITDRFNLAFNKGNPSQIHGA